MASRRGREMRIARCKPEDAEVHRNRSGKRPCGSHLIFQSANPVTISQATKTMRIMRVTMVLAIVNLLGLPENCRHPLSALPIRQATGLPNAFLPQVEEN
jgi:hypothetical protein